jgi:hypothetical protein
LITLLFSVILTADAAYAQAIPVSSTNKGMFASPNPTMTFLFEAIEAKATLIFIPGGEGHRGVKPDWTANHGYFSSYHFNVMLRSLTAPTGTSGQFNVIIFDSPADLPVRNHWSVARSSTDHLVRVEDVVRHYKERFGKPVWVMGHSMGSISITELYKRLQGSKSEDLVAGMIFSGGVNGTSFNYETTKLPVLVLHHNNDECIGTTPGNAKRIHTKLREAGNTVAELVLINSGTSQGGDSCRSGYHMYFGASPDVIKAIDQFMNKHLASR